MTDTPRVRFAPSPTGYLHLGGARTALFNWLYARHAGGVFVLRIEDTDLDRSSQDMVEGILDGLRWLGLEWDEGPGVGGPYGPYLQSDRLEQYRAAAERLVAGGLAYYCYCPPDDLKQKRAAAEARGDSGRYDGACRRLSADDIARREAAGDPRAVRFRVLPGQTRFDDLVHGPIAFDHANLEDFVILRSDGHPTYHLSVVVDDAEMRITHVIRGNDHVSNTPKQILLYGALQAPVPRFAHVPLILGPDRKRLSKRHGATSVTEYRRQGYLPEAMVNFLALLGWSPGDDRELLSRDELVAAFSIDRISSSSAVFNPEKLGWMNGQYLARLGTDEVARRVEPLFREAGLWRDEYAAGPGRSWLLSVIELFVPRAKRLPDFVEQARFLLADDVTFDEAAVRKHLGDPGLAALLTAVAGAIEDLEPFAAGPLETTVRALAARHGVKAPALIHAIRVAVTGRAASPGLFDVLQLLGRARTLARLAAAVSLVPDASGSPHSSR